MKPLTKVNASKTQLCKGLLPSSTHPDAEIQDALDSVAGQIRSMLGRRCTFAQYRNFTSYDDSEAKARAMDELLDRVAAMDAEKSRRETTENG